jgi:DMSO/TMAO reductase YedYZ molybdopterin-dependent catalytic subunit
MSKKKYMPVALLLIITLICAIPVISCTQKAPASSPPYTNQPSETAPTTQVTEEPGITPTAGVPSASPTVTIETPPILTWQDLSQFIETDPSSVDNTNFPLTPLENIGSTGDAPDVDIATYNLSVEGLVKNPLKLSYETLLQYPAESEALLLVCQGIFVANAEWTGVRVTTLLDEAGIEPAASQVIIHSLDNYQQSYTLDDVKRDGVFLAYKVNGQTLPKSHGYPIRLVMKGFYGYHWVKSVGSIEIK